MRTANLLALAQGFAAVPDALCATYEAQLSERDEPLDAIKQHEAESVCALADALLAHEALGRRIFEGYVFSFRIPQISAEFDLLKICDDAVINIELKSEDVGTDRIARQLKRNRHYLSPLERRVHLFTFVSNEGSLFELDGNQHLQSTSFQRLAEVLAATDKPYQGVVEDLFAASNYLVSPLNDTRRFLEGSYFLTNHQAQIKASFVTSCVEATASSEVAPPTFIVYGSAGTGKTLLLYDLARTLGKTRRACVIHCGQLCEGHRLLEQGQTSFAIVTPDEIEQQRLEECGAILVDEAQRLTTSQLERIVTRAAQARVALYLSLDRQQMPTEANRDLAAERVVRTTCPHASIWELSRKIRTNRELVGFIRTLFDLRGSRTTNRTNHVKVACASSAKGAQALVDAFRDDGYQYIAFAPIAGAPDVIQMADCPDTYTVVGQEFNAVVMAVGPSFSMDNNLHRQLLYQGITRARSHIALVVYDNDEFLARVLAC